MRIGQPAILDHLVNDVRADRRRAADKGGEQRIVGKDDLGDLAPEFRTGRFFSHAALAMVMSTLACAGVRYPTLEWRRCRL